MTATENLDAILEQAQRRNRAAQRRNLVLNGVTLLALAGLFVGALFIVQSAHSKVERAESRLSELREETQQLSRTKDELRQSVAELNHKRQALEQDNAKLTQQNDSLSETVAQVQTIAENEDDLPSAEVVDSLKSVVLKTESKRDSAYEAWKQGRAAVLAKDQAAARRFFEKSIETDQSYAPPYNSLGSIAFANKDYDATIAWSARALQRRPSYAPALFNTALAHEKKGNLAEAARWCTKADKARPKWTSVTSMKKRLAKKGVNCGG